MSSVKNKRTMVVELKAGRKTLPAAGSKRFTWSSPIVDPQKTVNQNFQSQVASAPHVKDGTYAPADLREGRALVASARKAKKKELV